MYLFYTYVYDICPIFPKHSDDNRGYRGRFCICLFLGQITCCHLHLHNEASCPPVASLQSARRDIIITEKGRAVGTGLWEISAADRQFNASRNGKEVPG